MRKSFFIFPVIITFILISSCNSFYGKSIRGEGAVINQTRQVGDFDKVQSFGSFDVDITKAENNSVNVETEENLQQYIDISIDNHTLNIRQKKNYSLSSPHGVRIRLSAPRLEAVRLYGSGNIRSKDIIPAADHLDVESYGSGDITYGLEARTFKAQVSGSGNLNFEGSATRWEGSINGSGNIKAGRLESDETEINISGSGNADVQAKEKLSVRISGSGNVSYWGTPEVNSHISGSGSVIRVK